MKSGTLILILAGGAVAYYFYQKKSTVPTPVPGAPGTLASGAPGTLASQLSPYQSTLSWLTNTLLGSSGGMNGPIIGGASGGATSQQGQIDPTNVLNSNPDYASGVGLTLGGGVPDNSQSIPTTGGGLSLADGSGGGGSDV